MKAVENSDKDYLLFIDEINRGNIPKIMGETLTLIEKSKRTQIIESDWDKSVQDAKWKITLNNGEELILPKNLFILATLNTSDRSVISMDSALRRRFAYYRMETLISETHRQRLLKELKVESTVVEKLIEVNKKLLTLGRDGLLGHSYVFDFAQDKYANENEFFQLTILPQIADILNSTVPNELKSICDSLNEIIGSSTHELYPDNEDIVFVKKKGGA